MLPNYRKILMATDLSATAIHAFKHAVMMARRNKAQLHLLHVVPEVDASMQAYISAMMVKGSLDRFATEHEDEARQEIARRLKQFAAEELANHPEDLARVASVDVVHGDPVVKILEAADRLQVDVIVLGAHGKGLIEYAFLGSTTERVLRKSKRPVFVIPIT
jgi:nucleotide-binding universal stress UspA family protein